MLEEFRIIPEFENYMVSNKGNVMSLNFKRTCLPKLMTLSKHSAGYATVSLRKNGKYHKSYVHRLVMKTFKGTSILEVNHINGVKNDNRLENLEYVTAKDNCKHAYRTGLNYNIGETANNVKLNRNKVLKILNSNLPTGVLAKTYKVAPSTICDIKARRTWKHIDKCWKK